MMVCSVVSLVSPLVFTISGVFLVQMFCLSNGPCPPGVGSSPGQTKRVSWILNGRNIAKGSNSLVRKEMKRKKV